MTPKACSPYAKRRFIRSFSEEDAVLKGMVETVADLGKTGNVDPGQGYVRQSTARNIDRLRAMSSIPTENIFSWLADQGALVVKTLKNGDQLLINAKGDPQDLGEWAAVMQTYFQGHAEGIRQLADNFIVSAQAGQGSVVQGLKLAQQLSWMGQMGEVILGYDQSLGRGLMAKKFAKQGFTPDELSAKIIKSQQDRMAAMASENAAQYSDRIGDIIERIGNPATKNEALDDLYELAEQIKFMNDPINVVKGTMGMKMVGNAWTEFFINGMLSSPSTWAVNAAGALWAPLRMGAQLFGAGLMRSAAAAGIGDQQMARGVWEMSMAQVMSLQSSLRDAAIMGWQALESGRSVYWDEAGIDATRSISGANASLLAQKLNRDPLDEGMKQTLDWVGRFIRIPSRILTGTDEFAKIIAQRGEVAQRAIKRALDDGVDMNDTKTVQGYLEAEAMAAFDLGPTTKFGQARYGKLKTIYDQASSQQDGFGGRTISRTGDEATFQERTGTLATAASSAVTGLLSSQAGSVMRPFIPFVRTPMNILGQGLEQATPVGPLVRLSKIAYTNKLSPEGIVFDIQKQLLASPTETARISGQIALMTVTAGTIVGMAQTGQMTGGGPSRWAGDVSSQARKRQQVWEQNNDKYTIKLGDGIGLPIDKFPEPVATLMRIAADLGSARAYMENAEYEEAFGAYVGVLVTGMWNSSALTGFDQLFKIFRDPSRLSQYTAENVQYWFSTQTPFSGLMNYVNKQVDPYERAYQTTNLNFLLNFEDVFGTGVLAKVAQRFPGGSQARPIEIDQLYGEPVPLTPGVGPNGVNPLGDAIPFLPRKGPGDEAWQAVWDIAGTWNDYKPGVELTLPEQMELNRRMGKIRIGGRTLSQAIMQLRKQPDVALMVEERGLAKPETGSQAALELSKLRTAYGGVAFAQMLQESTSLQERSALTDRIKRQKGMNDMQGARTSSQQLRQLLEIAGVE